MVVKGVMHEADNAYSILVVLSAGPIPHNSIHLLIITAAFVALYQYLLDMSFSLSLHFLLVLSLQTSVCSTLKFHLVLLGS